MDLQEQIELAFRDGFEYAVNNIEILSEDIDSFSFPSESELDRAVVKYINEEVGK